MKKQFLKMLVLITTILMLISNISTSVLANSTDTTTKQFTDIKGHWAEKEINDWVSKGLASGYEDGTFRPNNFVTRVEFVTFVNRAFNLTQTANINFKDVKPTNWFYVEVQKAKAANIISGYNDNTFRPNVPITREEAISIIVRLLVTLKKIPAVSTFSLNYLSNFNDVNNVSDWAKDAVNTAVAFGLIKGDSDNKINPKSFTTRAETVVMLSRSLSSLQLQAIPQPEPNSTLQSSSNTIINIPDLNLQEAIRLALNKSTGDITLNDMLKLTKLEAENKGISNLTGLEYAKNLTYLYLTNNQISDITPLKNLNKLQGLELSHNQISDISSLKTLANLKMLGLGYNEISDISPLQDLTKLRLLNLTHNQISNIKPLENLTELKTLGLAENQISDITPLKNLTKLIYLEINNNQIDDISSLKDLTNLRGLYLYSNQISDITPIKGLTNLIVLDLHNNKINYSDPLQLNAINTIKNNNPGAKIIHEYTCN